MYAVVIQTKRYSVIQHARQVYDELGYYKIEGFLRQEQVKQVIDELEAFKKKCLKEKKLNVPPFRALGNPDVLRDLRASCFGVEIFGTPGNIDTVGHGIHYFEDSICTQVAVKSPLVKQLVNTLTAIEEPTVVQTKAVMKPAKTGTRVPAHTDEQYIFTNPLSGLALWIALDPAGRSNGCVEVVPGSHKMYQQGQLFAADDRETITWTPVTPLPATKLEPFPYTKSELDKLQWVPIETNPGDCLVMHHSLLHASASNTSGQQRRALTVHMVDGACAWDDRNWIVPHPERGFIKI